MAEGEVLFMTNTVETNKTKSGNGNGYDTTTRSGSGSSGGNEDGLNRNGKAGPEGATSQDLGSEATSSTNTTPTPEQQQQRQLAQRVRQQKANASWASKQRNNGNGNKSNLNFHANQSHNNNHSHHYRYRNRRKGSNANNANIASNATDNNASKANANINVNAPPNQNSNNGNNGNHGVAKRSHKRPRRHHKRNGGVKRLRRNTQPAPNNNNEFLMKEHDDHFYYNNQLIDNGNKSLPFLPNGQSHHHRQRSYSSSQDDPLGLDVQLGNGEGGGGGAVDQFSSTSDDEEEEAYLARDFSNAYEVVHAERLNTMTKPQLIQEYQLLEERVESLEQTLRNVLEEKNQAKIHLDNMDRSGSSSGVGEEYTQHQHGYPNHTNSQNLDHSDAMDMDVEFGGGGQLNEDGGQEQVNSSTSGLNYGEDYYNSSEEDEESRNSGLLLTSSMLSQFQEELFRLRDENRKLRSDNKVLLKSTAVVAGYQPFAQNCGGESHDHGDGSGIIPTHAQQPRPPSTSTDDVCDTATGNNELTSNLASSSFILPSHSHSPTIPAAFNSNCKSASASQQDDSGCCDHSQDSGLIHQQRQESQGQDQGERARARSSSGASSTWNDVSTSTHITTMAAAPVSYATMTSPSGDDNVSSTAIP